MPVDINGYTLSNNAGLAFAATGTRVVAANYGITDPALPGMLGSATGGSGTFKVYPFPVNATVVNIGSPWNTSTYRFTAPVAGLYYISYSGIVGNSTATSSQGYNAIIVNGSNTYFSYKDTVSVWELQHFGMVYSLAANDWVSWAMNIAPAPDSTTNAGAYQSNHNMSTIWLVG